MVLALVAVSRRLRESAGIDLPKAEKEPMWFAFVRNLAPPS